MSTILSYAELNNRWNSPVDIEHVVKDLNENEDNVEILQFNGNTMGVDAAQELTEPLSRQSKLNTLLWNDMFTGRGKSEIGNALKSLSLGLTRAQVQLVEINLSDNAFGPNGVVGVTDLLASPCCYTLKVLNMNNQGLGHQGCQCLVNALKTARKDSDNRGMNLEVFIAGRNRLENAGMKMLAEVFGDGMSSLKKLHLLQNGIGIKGIDGMKNIILSIENHKDLRELNISDNTIKVEGMQLLCDVLPKFDKLEELYLGDCLIRSGGLNHLTDVLDDLSDNLKCISVPGNEITGKAAKKFITRLVESKSMLEKVDLNENEIRKSCWNEIKDIMEEYDKADAFVNEDIKNEDFEDEDEEDDEEEEQSDESGETSSDESNSAEDESEKSESEESHKEEYENGNKSVNNQNLPNTIKGNLFTSNLFQTPSIRTGTAKSNLFNFKNNEKNIFKLEANEMTESKSLFNPSVKNFSFISAAKSAPTNNDIAMDSVISQLKEFLLKNLKSESVSNIEDLSIVIEQTVDKNILDSSIYEAAESNPESAVRVGLVLCNKAMTFDLGVAVIGRVLTSPSVWSRATNAVLVEMNCIKSEDKYFVPFIEENPNLPIRVLEKVLNTELTLSNEVRMNLSVVLKNLNKTFDNQTEDLLKKLEASIGGLKI